jgi:hypothetical protein
VLVEDDAGWQEAGRASALKSGAGGGTWFEQGAYQRLSPELESRLAYTASETASYEAAAKMGATWGSPVSDGCIHQHVLATCATTFASSWGGGMEICLSSWRFS